MKLICIKADLQIAAYCRRVIITRQDALVTTLDRDCCFPKHHSASLHCQCWRDIWEFRWSGNAISSGCRLKSEVQSEMASSILEGRQGNSIGQNDESSCGIVMPVLFLYHMHCNLAHIAPKGQFHLQHHTAKENKTLCNVLVSKEECGSFHNNAFLLLWL